MPGGGRDRGDSFQIKAFGEDSVHAAFYRAPGQCDPGYASVPPDRTGDRGADQRAR